MSQDAQRHFIRITFANGQTVETTINGTPEEIRAYYVGQPFNLGNAAQDMMTTGQSVEFFDSQP